MSSESVGLLPARVVSSLDGILSGIPSRVFALKTSIEQSMTKAWRM